MHRVSPPMAIATFPKMSQTPTTTDPRWVECLRVIENNVTPQQFSTWFLPIHSVQFDAEQNKLTVCVPSPFIYEYIEAHFLQLLRSVLIRVYGAGVRLVYKVTTDATNDITVEEEATTRSTVVAQPASSKAQKPAAFDSQLNANYTFDNFVMGNSNKLPITVGKAIAENPNQMTFNPLFLYGPSGVGKTHLINAIGTRVKELHPEKRVLYVSAHLFQVQYTESVRQNTTNDFIAFYQSIDVLIIDDVQEFCTPATQLAFFHIFNHLHQNGRQIILSSDRPPIALQGMEERLITRFKWGLLAEIERPDQLLRKDILRSKIRRDGLKIDESVIDYIATHVNKSVRDLEGVINSLMAYSVVYNKDIDVELASNVIQRTVGQQKEREITIDSILDKTCAYYEIERDEVLSSSRKAAIVTGRQVAMYLTQKFTHMSTTRIGLAIGKRNHATVMHSCAAVNERLASDKAFKAQIESIEKLLKE